jgi:hypothetical protein
MGLQRREIGQPTTKYNCMAWGLGLNSVWVQPPDGKSPNVVMPHFGCKKTDCDKDIDCKKQAKVKVFEDTAQPDNWHVERQTCDNGWTSKYGQAGLYDRIPDPDADYADVYKPKGKTKPTCWSCPTIPNRLPNTPDVVIISR